MIDDTVIHIVRDTLIVSVKIVAPILIAGVFVGLVISILQSITSIQDQTLSFVPKIIAMIAVTAMLVPWIASQWMRFAAELFQLM
ncbi:MAG: flagellar biosynthetic protein FliQ [Phycisphaeraceae bacterium]|nr:flagellar biosynthetic protein FliQ [Phycisphaerales bacterium]MCB9861674.1 flagellar biosynthetic protein FliQ [Phycisphaeraceae bacterium]